ncbi:hypothetical protein [uncultured Phocaeicola sp.]|uniref:hypothetical protein n=1 Tax=uncultured Phocaeicola sp. TaxID=990718 RepID=UPI0025FD5506|nr:hypothetical protein [uncultured Phocaeicola sp.]
MKNVCKQVAWFRKAEKNVEFFKQESEDYMKNKKTYESPQTKHVEVELEEGFMKASVFDPEDQHDEGVTIQNHEFGETHDFTDEGWD